MGTYIPTYHIHSYLPTYIQWQPSNSQGRLCGPSLKNREVTEVKLGAGSLQASLRRQAKAGSSADASPP